MSASSTTTTTTSGGDGGPQIGYCHTCDRQVNIDPVSFECSQCHGGFVEIFDIDQQREAAAAAAAAAAQGNSARVIHMNNQNFGDVLPMFLQMLNPALAGMGANFGGAPAGMRSSSDPGATQAGAAGGLPHVTESSYSTRPGTTTTRFQVILPSRPNEAGHDQIDLYGVINNVINDLLDPRRAQIGGGGPNTFHFQAPPIRIINLHSDARDYAWGAGGLDAIITQLLNQLENTGPPPASQDQVINLPVITITQDYVDKNAQCAICMEDFNLDEKAKQLPCKHLFHEPCITEWLRLHGTCPVCRKNLSGEDTSQREYISRPPPNQNNNNNNNNNDQGGGEGSTSSSSAANETTSTSSTQQNPSNNDNRSNNNNNNFYDADFD